MMSQKWRKPCVFWDGIRSFGSRYQYLPIKHMVFCMPSLTPLRENVRNVLIFTGQTRHRLVSATQPMCAMYHYLQVKLDIGLCPQHSRCAQCSNFYRSNSTSANVRNAADVRNVPIFTGQTRHRLVPATQPMCAMYQFLHVKLDIGWCPQCSRCAQCINFYKSNSTSANARNAADVHRTLFFNRQIRHRVAAGPEPMCTEPYFLISKLNISPRPDPSRCAPNPIF